MKELNITTNSKLFALRVNVYKTDTLSVMINSAQQSDCDILALYFEVEKEEQVKEAVQLLKNSLPAITKPLMICGSGKSDIDKVLLPELIKVLDRVCIISFADETNYKTIVPYVISGNHYIVLKSPIDINLAKELNILSVDLGLAKNRIIMNTDIGGLGYGYEYGYSILEKVVIEAQKGDEYLILPLLSEAAIESLKTKEAKADTYSKSWGSLSERARMIELAAASGVLSAGANIIVMTNPDNIAVMKGLV